MKWAGEKKVKKNGREERRGEWRKKENGKMRRGKEKKEGAIRGGRKYRKKKVFLFFLFLASSLSFLPFFSLPFFS